MPFWHRMFMLTALAAVGALILCSCGGGAFPEPDLSVYSSLGAIQGYLKNSDTPGNDPVQGAFVWSTPANVSTSSDSSGYYILTGLPQGWYHVTARADDTRQASGDVYVQAGKTATLDIDFAWPTPPPDLQELLYLSDDVAPGTPYAWLSNTSGNDPQRLQPELSIALSFIRWNPADENEFIYKGTGANDELFVYSTSTRTPARVTFNGYSEMGAAFSPDGTRIVYASDVDGDGNYEISVMNRDGSGSTILVDDLDASTGHEFDNRWPAWSPDGYSIAFATRRTELGAPVQYTDYEIAVIPVTGGSPEEITSDLVDDIHPAWHPNSVVVAWSKRWNLHYQLYAKVADADAEATALTSNLYDDYAPSFSWDGHRICWCSNGNYDGTNSDGSTEVWTAEYNGSNLSETTHVTRSAAAVTCSFAGYRPRWVERTP